MSCHWIPGSRTCTSFSTSPVKNNIVTLQSPFLLRIDIMEWTSKSGHLLDLMCNSPFSWQIWLGQLQRKSYYYLYVSFLLWSFNYQCSKQIGEKKIGIIFYRCLHLMFVIYMIFYNKSRNPHAVIQIFLLQHVLLFYFCTPARLISYMIYYHRKMKVILTRHISILPFIILEEK